MVVEAGISSTTLVSLVMVPSSVADTCGRERTLSHSLQLPSAPLPPPVASCKCPQNRVGRRSQPAEVKDFSPVGLVMHTHPHANGRPGGTKVTPQVPDTVKLGLQ